MSFATGAMKTISRQLILCIFFLMTAVPSFAAEKVVQVETRPGVSVPVYYIKRAHATATVVLLTGGNGSIQLTVGIPLSSSFLVTSRDYFADSGFNVAVIDKPSDTSDLDFHFRSTPEHLQDLRQVVAYLKNDENLPVWLVGNSRGTISATAAAIALGNEELAGLVLTSSITDRWKKGAVPSQDLKAIRIPVLVVHHAQDACRICKPRNASRIMKGLTNAPIKKLVMVEGGGPPSGKECTSTHWHGFVGMEKEVVSLIAEWIKDPVN
jgi:pimeloyl-ACP methyl ester carboxylesterase